MLYVVWYRWTFRRRGLLPVFSLWRFPKRSLLQVGGLGLFLFIFSWVLGHPLKEFVPGPTSMLVALLALLMMLQAFYGWLVLFGPLMDTDAPEEE